MPISQREFNTRSINLVNMTKRTRRLLCWTIPFSPLEKAVALSSIWRLHSRFKSNWCCLKCHLPHRACFPWCHSFCSFFLWFFLFCVKTQLPALKFVSLPATAAPPGRTLIADALGWAANSRAAFKSQSPESQWLPDLARTGMVRIRLVGLRRCWRWVAECTLDRVPAGSVSVNAFYFGETTLHMLWWCNKIHIWLFFPNAQCWHFRDRTC